MRAVYVIIMFVKVIRCTVLTNEDKQRVHFVGPSTIQDQFDMSDGLNSMHR